VSKRQPVFVLFGPTASGKTELLESLFAGNAVCREAPLPRAEIVSADSMQVYRGMDIGTAKPSATLRAVFPHHLIDIRNPREPFNAGDFVRLADAACADIARRGRLPVVSGGTGFYLRNFIYGLSEAPPSDSALRAALKTELAEKSAECLFAELARRDGESASRIHPNDTYRLLRALEVCRLTGRPLASFAVRDTPRAAYRFLIVELRRPRGDLYRRIDERCRAMFRQGLAEEATRLFREGYTPDDPGMRAIGYREFFVDDGGEGGRWRLSGDREGVMALIARNSRRYAKRQITFFASIREAVRLDAESSRERILDLLCGLVHTGKRQTSD
jgi:tRNA dimethylallyltransferase